MLIAMRYVIVVLVLATLACSKKEPAGDSHAAVETEVAAEAEVRAAPAAGADPSEAQVPSLEPTTVKLINAGKPPLGKVRWQFHEGATEVLEMTTTQTIDMKGGGWDHVYVPVGIAQTIDFATTAVSTDGIADVALTIREVEELDTKGANSPAIEGGKGATATYKVDSMGVIQDLVLVGAPDSIYKATDLDVLRGLIRMTVVPFPAEAIGVGAKWTVTQGVYEFQTALTEQMAIELIDVGGPNMTLRVEIKGSGSRHVVIQEGNEQTISLDTDTKLLVKVSLKKLVPRSSKLEHKTAQTVTVIGADDPDGQLKVNIDRKVTMRSKK